jgi:Na+-transporting NADH:ubiquinone oxidoreductase subunit D
VKHSALRTLSRPIVDENPITLQILGICSALAVTRRLDTALLMGASVIFVLTCSNAAISLIRRQVPHSIRLIVQITLIATLVTVVDQFLKAFASSSWVSSSPTVWCWAAARASPWETG